MLQVGIFIAVTVAVLALMRVLSNVSRLRGRFHQRLTEEFSTTPGTSFSPLYKDLDALDQSDSEDGPQNGRIGPPLRQPTWRDRTEEFLRQAGVSLNARQLLGVTAGAAVVLGSIGLIFGGVLIGLSSVVAGAIAPVAIINVKRKVRREMYLKQLVGAFELMARVLRAGQSVPEAFRAAADAFEDPLAGEFRRCLHQIEHGLRPESAFRELSLRAGILELRLFVVAMTIQRQTGGNLSEVLDRLAGVIRTRLRIRQKIRALTAEGRLQSVTLTVLPVVTFGVMYFLNRQYAELLLAQWRLLLVAVGCVIVGTVWIRNIMSFEG